MPKIPMTIINSVFYLYHTKEDALAGKPFGGTGFFVGVSSGLDDYMYCYGVTNWHVACRDGASVIRVNTTDGRVDILEFDPAEWLFKPGRHDVAVVPVSGLEPNRHNLTVLSRDMFLTQESAARLDIGPGDDVFMIGRFVDHDGGGTNVPAARFGNISVMPQPVPQPNKSTAPSFILDVHSRTGYSGSPVFIYRTIASDLTRGAGLYLNPGAQFLQLLGIHWGQFPERWEIEKDSGVAKIDSSQGIALSGNATYIKGLSGMTMAAPAWAIQELLDLPKLKEMRAQDTEIQRRKRTNMVGHSHQGGQ